MADSRSHVPAMPPGFIAVRIIQALFTISILGLSAFIFSVTNHFDELLVLVCAIVTTIILIWLFATYRFPRAYNYWAVLAFEILLFLFWVNSSLWAASGMFNTYSPYNDCPYTYNVTSQSYSYDCDVDTSEYDQQQVANNAAIAVFALTIPNNIMWLISMIIVSVFIARHRDNGGHNRYGSEPPVERSGNVRLLEQNMSDLRTQNLALQQQFIELQQQNLDLQRTGGGVIAPQPVMHSPGQRNVARGDEAYGESSQIYNAAAAPATGAEMSEVGHAR